MEPNHIHAQTLDILSSLRIALMRRAAAEHDVHMGPSRRTSETSSFLKDLPEHAWVCIDGLLRHYSEKLDPATWAENGQTYPVLELGATEIELLSPCLLEAIATAYQDGFTNRPGSVIQSMSQLYNEINSGRRPVRLVFGKCEACWPESPVTADAHGGVGEFYADVVSNHFTSNGVPKTNRSDAAEQREGKH